MEPITRPLGSVVLRDGHGTSSVRTGVCIVHYATVDVRAFGYCRIFLYGRPGVAIGGGKHLFEKKDVSELWANSRSLPLVI